MGDVNEKMVEALARAVFMLDPDDLPDEHELEVAAGYARIAIAPVRAAARELLRLKHGPRDEAYYAAKDEAWSALERALGGRA